MKGVLVPRAQLPPRRALRSDDATKWVSGPQPTAVEEILHQGGAGSFEDAMAGILGRKLMGYGMATAVWKLSAATDKRKAM